ncbi:hypothetical protein [Burkholderia sp. PU8-34]
MKILGIVRHLRQWLMDAARKLDEELPRKREHVVIDRHGEPILRKAIAKEKLIPH